MVRRRLTEGVLVGVLALIGSATAAAATTPSISLNASREAIRAGQSVVLSGHASDVPVGDPVLLYATPYPYRPARLVAQAAVGPDDGFRFAARPDRDTRYRVVLGGTLAHAVTEVDVSWQVVYKIHALPLGRALVTLVVFHPRDLRWANARVAWSVSTPTSRRFRVVESTRAMRISPYVVVLRMRATLPAGVIRWRACFHAAEDHALANPRPAPGCSGRGYYGSVFLPSGYPGRGAVARAARYLGGRIGRTAFAIVDSEGRLSGLHEHWTFVSASVVKAMLLVAYLRMLHARGQHYIDSYSDSFLYPMINVSDNSAATQTWSIVGDSGLYRVAAAAGMTDFSIVGIWANAQISPADQARFFFGMDALVPREFVGYARFLLSTIAGYESWGIPAIARPRGYAVFFKGGWRGTGLGQLVHQVARLEGHGRRFSIAVMTDGDPSMGYGIDTVQGVTASLL